MSREQVAELVYDVIFTASDISLFRRKISYPSSQGSTAPFQFCFRGDDWDASVTGGLHSRRHRLHHPSRRLPLGLCATTFRSAADSDVVWNRFLRPKYLSKISDPGSVSSLPKKELYLRTCHNLIHNGKLCFWNDLQSGKKCYMISPNEPYIMGMDDVDYDTIAWSRYSLPDLEFYFEYIPFGRFPEVIMRDEPDEFEIRGKISTSLLSPMTTYVAYLVFFLASVVHIEHVAAYIEYSPIEVFAGLAGSNNGQRRTVYFHREHQDGDDNGLFPKKWAGLLENEFSERCRWLESELGEFFNRGDEEGELLMNVKTTYNNGLIVQGIEIRPKNE